MLPFGGPSSAQVGKSRSGWNAGMSYPLLPATKRPTDSRSHRCISRLLADDLFCEKLQIPQYDGWPGSNRPFGPFGDGKCQHCSPTFGASRTATAQAEGGFMMKALCPEISALLLLES